MAPKKKAAKKKSAPRTTGYRVESESYPSGTGCYAGQDLSDDYIEACTTTTIVGEYETWEQAKEAAIQERDSNCQFEDWAEDYYDDQDPPYFSSDGQNYDEDDTTHIYIVDIAKEVAQKEKENVQKKASTKLAAPSLRPKRRQKRRLSGQPRETSSQTWTSSSAILLEFLEPCRSYPQPSMVVAKIRLCT